MPASSPGRYVRKQLSVTPEQDRAFKRRSQELGVPQAELVRRAPDAALADGPVAPPPGSPLDELSLTPASSARAAAWQENGIGKPSTTTGATGAVVTAGPKRSGKSFTSPTRPSPSMRWTAATPPSNSPVG